MQETKIAPIDEILTRVTQLIREKFHPEKIILFGSQARNAAHRDSDIDLLVVMPTENPPATESAIREVIGTQGIGIDVVVYTLDKFRRYRDVPGTIVRPAWREGRYLYGEPEPWIVAQEPPPYGEIAKPMFVRATDELSVGKDLLAGGKDYALESICFISQQIAEKSIKAVLITLGVDYPRTHDLAELAKLLHPEMQSRLRKADFAMLTKYAVESRYGEHATCPNRVAAEKAVAAAERIWEAVRPHF